ncbi:MAG TPA: tripartite tricarboxylate transporter substrate binding protein [Burkholderiales bacterium]|nr:tripartite tricarboxylate transporter substrate binding protein [Burkholderiales bacterium]
MRMMKIASGVVTALLLTGSASGPLHAQQYPSKPIRLVLPFPPGAPSDLVGRTIGQRIAEQMGQSLIPDNRTGAGGTLGLSIVAKSPPDGYTLLVTSPTMALSPLLYSNLSYDVGKDFTPVARLASIENVMLVHPSVPVRTLKEFIALARANPGKLNYGSGGPGTTNHLANELLKSLEKLNMVHVPYKGATVATTALMGGEVDEVIVSVASVLPLINAGRVRALAVLSEKRLATLPNVPTSKEAGYPNFQMSIWYGMMAPGGTPREIVTRLHREIARALEDPALRKHMANAGMDPWLGTPEDMGNLLRSEMARYAKIIQSAGIKKDAL